jgi:tight adherence protein C
VLVALVAFLIISAAAFGLLMLFVRGGRNQPVETAGALARRPLVFGALTRPLAGILPMRPETRQRYARFLHQAGHYHSQALVEYLSLRNALLLGAILLSVTAIVVFTTPGDPAMYQFAIGGGLLVALLFALPRLILESMARNRSRRIEHGLPDAMDMITMCISAGLPLQQAILRISDELQSSHPDLAFELRIVARQTEASSLNAAIQQFAKRLDVPEIHSVAAMVWQAEQQGASVAGAFQAFSDQVRLSRRQRAEEIGNKASFKLLFPLVFCLAPAVYLMLLGPAVMDLREFFRRESRPGGVLSSRQQNVDSMMSAPPGAPPEAFGPGGPPAAPPQPPP